MPYFEEYSHLAFKKSVEVTKWNGRIIFFQAYYELKDTIWLANYFVKRDFIGWHAVLSESTESLDNVQLTICTPVL